MDSRRLYYIGIYFFLHLPLRYDKSFLIQLCNVPQQFCHQKMFRHFFRAHNSHSIHSSNKNDWQLTQVTILCLDKESLCIVAYLINSIRPFRFIQLNHFYLWNKKTTTTLIWPIINWMNVKYLQLCGLQHARELITITNIYHVYTMNSIYKYKYDSIRFGIFVHFYFLGV